MIFNAALIAALCAAGHSTGSINAAPNGEIVIRIPKISNMSQASEVADLLKGTGAFISGYGVNLTSTYDTFVGATITLEAPVMKAAA